MSLRSDKDYLKDEIVVKEDPTENVTDEFPNGF